MADPSVLAELRKALNEPDPEDLIAKSVAGMGPWASWTFQRQIWYLRKKAGLSQKDLARRSGVTQARLSRIEKGADLKLSTLASIFLALGHDLLVVPGPIGRKREHRQFWQGRPFDPPGAKVNA